MDSVISSSLHGITVLTAVRNSEGEVKDFHLVLSNHSAEEIMGKDLARAQLTGETMLVGNPESAHDGAFDRFRQVVETGKPVAFEHYYEHGGTQKWLFIRAAKREDGVVVTLADISERVLAEEKLRRSELILRMAGRMSKVGGWTMEYPSRKVAWTDEVYHIHEVPPDYIPTVNEGLDFYTPECKEIVEHAFESCVRDGTPFDLEVEIITGKGRRVWVRTMAQAEMEDGKLRRVIGTFQDITAAKGALLELRESQLRLINSLSQEQELTRRAQAAERAKGEFLAVMSHEIRTPMNGVIGMTNILADTELNAVQRDCVSTIQVSGEALLTVINDILDFSKVESGKLNLERQPFDLRQCVEDAVDLFAAKIREKKLEVAYLIAPEVPASLLGDSTRLRQILINLIGNAIKFTERGEVTLHVQCQTRDEKGCHLRFSIADTGIGIPKDSVDRLFQSFQQVDSSTTRRYGGTGLGLAISKRLAELMGGTIWVESEPGVGSTFFFTVVLEAAPILGTVGGPSAVLKSSSVLIVDDSETNRRILDTQLKAWGMVPTSVSSGADALQRLEAEKFDVALLDLQMPDMDGVNLARAIRGKGEMPIIPAFFVGRNRRGGSCQPF